MSCTFISLEVDVSLSSLKKSTLILLLSLPISHMHPLLPPFPCPRALSHTLTHSVCMYVWIFVCWLEIFPACDTRGKFSFSFYFRVTGERRKKRILRHSAFTWNSVWVKCIRYSSLPCNAFSLLKLERNSNSSRIHCITSRVEWRRSYFLLFFWFKTFFSPLFSHHLVQLK